MNHGGTEALRFGDVTEGVIGACIEVHRHLGPGLLESAYERALSHELMLRGHACARQVPLPMHYKGVDLQCDFRLDLVVGERVVVEVKAVERLLPVHEAQLLTYLKLTGLTVGLLVNFNAPTIRAGLRRLIL